MERLTAVTLVVRLMPAELPVPRRQAVRSRCLRTCLAAAARTLLGVPGGNYLWISTVEFALAARETVARLAPHKQVPRLYLRRGGGHIRPVRRVNSCQMRCFRRGDRPLVSGFRGNWLS